MKNNRNAPNLSFAPSGVLRLNNRLPSEKICFHKSFIFTHFYLYLHYYNSKQNLSGK